MKDNKKRLDFHSVDGLGFAASQGKLNLVMDTFALSPARIGPLLELVHLSATGLLPHPKEWMDLGRAGVFLEALESKSESWIRGGREDLGFIRAIRHGSDSETRFDEFLISAKRAAKDIAGLPNEVAGQLVGAMRELESNIHEHSDSPQSGLVAFKAQKHLFEFVVSDKGVGILRSLRRQPIYEKLLDEGSALNAALTDGVSRFGPDANRGYGFKPIFVGLTNLRGELRFRSGDHALTMDGTSPTVATAAISQKSRLHGFYASIACHFNQPRPSI